MEQKILPLLARHHQVEALLGDPSLYEDKKRYKELSQEHSYLTELKHLWEDLQQRQTHLKEIKDLRKEEGHEPDFSALLEEEEVRLESSIDSLQAKIQSLLVPPNPNDHRNTIVELRAGTGGDEAALFVGNVFRMYRMYAERQGWTWETLSATPSDMGGYKEIVLLLTGKNVFRFMQFEAGTHRVQRVPETETQGRIHTSAMTVAILVEPAEEEEINIDEKDLRIDTYRASGAGGQHVNTTDSAVRITHIPSGIVAHCQEERSQHKNKEKALRYLQAKLQEVERAKRHREESSLRSLQIGSGDRSERIRTYNFPQNRVTDHRINMTRHNLDKVLEGELDEFSQALLAHAKAI